MRLKYWYIHHMYEVGSTDEIKNPFCLRLHKISNPHECVRRGYSSLVMDESARVRPSPATFILLLLLFTIVNANTPPHIVIILADDLGWNDVSFHGSNQFQTPNIDALAYSGVILHNYYTQPICTPARAALLSGRHPIHNGMEHDVIYASQPWGLPLSESLMPQYLQSSGYVTRAVGKWHLGSYKADYTPTRRGFDSFYGSWLGHQDHFTHMTNNRHPGYDLHRDLNVSWEGRGRYNADLFTEEAETIILNHNVTQPLFLYLSHTVPHAPVQAPEQVVNRFHFISRIKRRKYAAMVTKLDESVGRVVKALKDNGMLSNSIILFLSDNGGATNGFNGNMASNWPLRGGKDTLWEGGVRTVGLLWSPLLQATPRVHYGVINVQDWLPTLLSAASLDHTEDLSKLDGVSQWETLNNLSEPPYHTFLHNIDPVRKIAALRHGKWKIIIGRTRSGSFDGWYGRLTSASRHASPQMYSLSNIRDSATGQAVRTTSSSLPSDPTLLSLRSQTTISCTSSTDGKENFETECEPHHAPCLFNVQDDPCEFHNLAVTHPETVDQLLALLMEYHPVKPNNKPTDPRSFPFHWNNTWTTWQDFI